MWNMLQGQHGVIKWVQQGPSVRLAAAVSHISSLLFEDCSYLQYLPNAVATSYLAMGGLHVGAWLCHNSCASIPCIQRHLCFAALSFLALVAGVLRPRPDALKAAGSNGVALGTPSTVDVTGHQRPHARPQALQPQPLQLLTAHTQCSALRRVHCYPSGSPVAATAAAGSDKSKDAEAAAAPADSDAGEPAKRNLLTAADSTRRFGWLSFWSQLTLSVVSCILFAFSVAFAPTVTSRMQLRQHPPPPSPAPSPLPPHHKNLVPTLACSTSGSALCHSFGRQS